MASFEVVDLPLLSEVAKRGKPVIMSTGMASRDEIDEAVATLRSAGCRQLGAVEMHRAAYPDPVSEGDEFAGDSAHWPKPIARRLACPITR